MTYRALLLAATALLGANSAVADCRLKDPKLQAQCLEKERASAKSGAPQAAPASKTAAAPMPAPAPAPAAPPAQRGPAPAPAPGPGPGQYPSQAQFQHRAPPPPPHYRHRLVRFHCEVEVHRRRQICTFPVDEHQARHASTCTCDVGGRQREGIRFWYDS